MSSFFFYIYSHIESVDIHSWQIRKNWFQNRNRSLCELCIQGAICEKHTCHVVFCSILYISLFRIFFCSYYPSSFRIAWIHLLLFTLPLSFSLPFRYFFFIWTVVHLIGCTGLLGTDNWLANNSSNNIRAYDIQVLIYTLHRYFFLFSFLGATTFLERVHVCERTRLSSVCVQACAEMLPEMRGAPPRFGTFLLLLFFRWSLYAGLEFKFQLTIPSKVMLGY